MQFGLLLEKSQAAVQMILRVCKGISLQTLFFKEKNESEKIQNQFPDTFKGENL